MIPATGAPHGAARSRALSLCALLGIALVGILRAAPALDPESLYLDDQWVAVLARDASLADLARLDPPAPHGFVLLLKGVRALFGDGAWQLQLVPLACSALTALLLGWLALQLTGSGAAALIAALCVVLDPELAAASVRVKPFALDALAASLLLVLFVRAVRAQALASWIALLTAAALLPLFSFPALFVGLVLVLVAAGHHLLGKDDSPRSEARVPRAWILAGSAVYALIAGTLFVLVLREQSSPAIRDYWRAFYLPLDSFGEAWGFVQSRGGEFITDPLPGGRAAWLLPLSAALLTVWRARESRPIRAFAIGAAAIFLLAWLLAATGRYPIGAGRTDLYAHPLFHLAAAIGWTAPLPGARWLRAAVVVCLIGAFAWCTAATPVRYPETGDRAMVERLRAEINDDDALVVYPWSNWALAYYGPWPTKLVENDDSTNGFYAIPVRERTLVLAERAGGVEFRAAEHVVGGQLAPWLRRPADRLWFLGTEIDAQALGWVRARIHLGGFRAAGAESSGAAALLRFDR